ncbi:MAG: 2-hydroxyglutaryl-CoA dehydratase [Dehalococcoidia bacterium]|nr:MAG: 2-hydroxyglutaryl-CoA dehydratase [Dehalococcoidia bacterium]
MKVYLGVDVGSITTKTAVINDNNTLLCHTYLPTQGNAIHALKKTFEQLKRLLPIDSSIQGVATTGSARHLAGAIIGADVIKNEITSQAIAALDYMPDVRTIIEIGGQDSKIIILRDGLVTDFSMNTVCAAGTGSFIDHQAHKLGIDCQQFGHLATTSHSPINISGKCTVFTESDIIHKQQTGYCLDGIIYGLCQALVSNYLSNVGQGKDIFPPILFQGGVAFNKGITRAFEEELKTDILLPPHPEIMGAIGAALLAKEELKYNKSNFRGFEMIDCDYETSLTECSECNSLCQIFQLLLDGRVISSWGGLCDSWQRT